MQRYRGSVYCTCRGIRPSRTAYDVLIAALDRSNQARCPTTRERSGGRERGGGEGGREKSKRERERERERETARYARKALPQAGGG